MGKLHRITIKLRSRISFTPPVSIIAGFTLSTISAILYVLAFAGVGWWPVGYIALCPLLYSIRNQSLLKAGLFGVVAGAVSVGAGFSWLVGAFVNFMGLSYAISLLAFVAFILWHSGSLGLFALMVARLHQKKWPWTWAVAAGLIVSETLYPVIFPWYLGSVLHRFPLLIQTASLGGPVLVGLPLAIISGLVTEKCVHRSSAPSRSWLQCFRLNAKEKTVFVLTVFLPILYSAVVIPFVDDRTNSAPELTLGIVQGNISMSRRNSAADGVSEPTDSSVADRLHHSFKRQVELSHRMAQQGAELIIWPESAFIHVLDASDPQSIFSRTQASSIAVPLLTGALLEPLPSQKRNLGFVYNSALLFSEHGKLQSRYDKQKRIAFAEYLPFEQAFPWLRKLFPQAGHVIPGSYTGPLAFEDKRITSLICYEDLFPGYVKQVVKQQRSQLLVNLTNDAWFDPSPASRLHHAMAKFRAIEHRQYLVRATNSGISAVIDPVGRELLRVEPREQAASTQRVRWMYGETLYGRWGNLPWYFLIMAACIGCIMPPPQRLRSRDTHGW